MLLLLLRAAAAHNISTEAERGTAYCFFLLRLRYYYCCFLCVYSIAVAVAAVEKGYAFLFFGRGAAAANRFLVGCADAAAGACAAYNISTEAERGTGYCFLLLRFCPLHCDASDVYCCCCYWLLLFLSFRLRCFGCGC